jgi:NAD(P) transhydrogenase subunit alpha
MTTTIGVVRESVAGERRVALTPDGAGRLQNMGLRVLVEVGAGESAWFDDADYIAAGAAIDGRRQVYADSDVIVCVRPPTDATSARPGALVVGLLGLLTGPALAEQYAGAGLTAVSVDLLPRTLSRAQGMDALTSQANVAGYKAVLVAAGAYGGYLPMLMTAAGTTRPAQVLVLGAGVAGLQAIATARRLGAMVTGSTCATPRGPTSPPPERPCSTWLLRPGPARAATPGSSAATRRRRSNGHCTRRSAASTS